LLGCGTLSRGDSYKDIYRGVAVDKKQIKNAYLWAPTLGLWPLFHIISLPVDAVIDTVLLPIDILLKHSPKRDHAQVSLNIPIFAVNMTNTPDFNYTFKNKRTGKSLAKGITSKIPETGSNLPTLDIFSVLTQSNPSPRIDSVDINWQSTESALLNSSFNEAVSYVETRTPDGDLRGARSIIVLFMPCNKVAVINSDRPFYSSDFINQKSVHEYNKLLTKLAEHSQCAQAAQVNSAIENAWK